MGSPVRLVFVDDRATETEVGFAEVAPGRTAVTIEQRGLDGLPPGVADHVRRFGWRLLAGWFAAALSATPEEIAMTETTPSETTTRGATVQGASPYLFYADAGAALDWLARVFGFVEQVRYVDPDGVVRESEIRVGATTIQLCGHAPAPGHGEGLLTIVHVDDVDAQHARVVAAGVDAAGARAEALRRPHVHGHRSLGLQLGLLAAQRRRRRRGPHRGAQLEARAASATASTASAVAVARTPRSAKRGSAGSSRHHARPSATIGWCAGSR